MKERIVLALGGNALGKTPADQLELVKETAKTIVDLQEDGYQVIVSHGNGPQVGMINLAFDTSESVPFMPFAECGAMSQGYIGYHLQQAIGNELKKRKQAVGCITVITQVVVDQKDPAFSHPTKPVGSFYSQAEAEQIAKEKGFTFVEDAGRGYRRVVPSPLPVRIVELDQIRQLSETGNIVIACGGGGIPVLEDEIGLTGIAAVIDKDRTSALLATELKADRLVILTAVDKVCLHFHQPDQKEIDAMNLTEAQKWLKQGEFAAGSMKPKVEACLDFVSMTGKGALITSLAKAREAIEGKTGTVIKGG